MNEPAPRRTRRYFGFGPYRLYPVERELFRGPEPVDLTPKATDTLLLLVSRRGHLVEKEELLRTLWPDTFVEEANLTQQIVHLRKVLGNGPDERPYIETVPRRGYRFTARVTESWEGEESSGERPAVQPAMPERLESRRRWIWVVAVAAVAAVAIGLAAWRLIHSVPDRQLLLTQLTIDTGLTSDPAISPDGKLVAYASDRSGEGHLDIWVQQVPRGKPIRLTREKGNDYEPSFSPDGSRIVFVSDRSGASYYGGGIYVVPALGGETTKVAEQGRRPRFSPDGKWIAYWAGTRHSAGSVYVVPSRGGPAREVIPPSLRSGSSHSRSPVWTPDGTHLLISRSPITEHRDWWVMPLEEGAPIRTGAFGAFSAAGLKDADTPFAGLVPEAWIPDTHDVVFSARSGDSVNLWTIPISPKNWKVEGAPRRLTAGPGPDFHAAVSDGGRVVFSNVRRNLDIWSLPVDPNAGKVVGDIRQLTHGAAQDASPSISADGKRMAFESDRTGKQVVWTMNLETGEERALTDTSSLKNNPLLSPDGTKVVYTVWQPDAPTTVFLVSFSGGLPQEVCEGWRMAWDWTPDGERILHNAVQPKPPHLGLLNPATGERRIVVQHATREIWKGFFSPDGRWIVFGVEPPDPRAGQFIAPFREGTAAPESEWIPTRGIRWSPDGNRLYGVSGQDGFRCIWTQRLDPATKRAVGELEPVYHSHDPGRSLGNLAMPGEIGLSVAWDKLVFAMGELTGNIWMAEPERGRE